MSTATDRARANADAAIEEHDRMLHQAQATGCAWVLIVTPILTWIIGRLL